MSKKLLSEAQIRRFAKLASIEPIQERWGSKKGEYKRHDVDGVEKKTGDVDGHYKDYEGPVGGNKGDKSKTHPGRKDYMQEDAFEDIEGEVDAELPPGEEVELGAGEEEIADVGAGEEVEMEADLGDPEQVATEIFTAIADVLGVEIDVGGDLEGEEVVDDTEVVDDVGGDLEGEDTEVVDAEEEEMLQEALKGINYIPGRKQIVNEVAKRVAKRLLKAQKAQKDLQEAIGNPRRTRK